MMSEEEDKYKGKLHVLASTCEAIQRENEEVASQVVKTKRNLCKARRLRMRLLHKLDEIGDPWRLTLDPRINDIPIKGISFKGQRSLVFNKLDKPGTSNSLSTSTSLNTMLPMPDSPTPSFEDHALMNESISNGL